MKADNAVDSMMILVGSIYSVVNIQEVLGIIILVLQAIWLLSKLVVASIRYYKGEINSNEMLDKLEDFKEDIEDLENGQRAK